MASKDIGKVEYASLLYDFYGELLGDSQRDVMDLYHEDDMSLSEIAEELGQTRQGVHYTLKRAEASLEKFEEKLGLVKAYMHGRDLKTKADDIFEEAWNELLEILKKIDAPEVSEEIESVRAHIEELHSLVDELVER